MILPGTAAWRRFWRGSQWSKRALAKLRKKNVKPLVFNKIKLK